MSGRKTYTISDAEYYRYRQAAARLRTIDADLPTMIERLQRQTREGLEQNIATIRQRQEGFDRAIEGVSAQIRQSEAAIGRRLAAQAAETARDLTAHRAWTAEALREQESRLHAEIEVERAERERQIASVREDITEVQGRVDDLEQHRERARVAAEHWQRDAARIRGAVAALPHERFAPGEMTRIEADFDAAATNLRDGQYESALSGMQGAYRRLSELRITVTTRERLWLEARSDADVALRRVLVLIDRNRRRTPVHMDGSPSSGELLDVDYWSHGALDELEQRTNDLLASVRDDAAPMPTDALAAVTTQAAPAMEASLQDIAESAGMCELMSQRRATIADIIAQTLQADYFEPVMEESDYVRRDQREAFVTKMRHPDQSEIVVILTEDGQVSLSAFETGVISESVRQRRAEAIHAALRQRGVEVGDARRDADSADPETKDVPAILRDGVPVGIVQPVSRPVPVRRGA
jgi:hypothetical protein